MGKVIAITGAGAGLGRVLAKQFAEDGDTVILLGRTLSKVETVADEIGLNAMAVHCDVGDPTSVSKAFSEISNTHHKIDVLINNAAIYEPYLINDASDEKIIQTLMINLAGPIFTTKAAIAMMERGGHIINITSESVGEIFPMLSLYLTSKAGVEAFTKSMTKELRPQGIRASFVRAGAMYDELKTWDIDPELRNQFIGALMKDGHNPQERGVTHFRSVGKFFRTLIDLPDDLEVMGSFLGARKP